ncbi:MAG: tetratricopeptide repeat protein [Deinococcales bacterium]
MRLRPTYLLVAALGVLALSSASAQTASPPGSCGNISALQATVTQKPQNVEALVQLGEAQLCLGRLQKSRVLLEAAQDNLENATNLDGNNFNAGFLLGQVYFELGDLDAAAEEFTRLSKVAPERAEAFYQLGVVQARLRKPDEAIGAFRKAAELAKNNRLEANFQRDVNVALAGQLLQKKDFAGAAAVYKAAQEFSPNDTDLQIGEAQAWFNAERNAEALEVVNRILAKNRGHVAATWLVASIYEKQGASGRERAVRELTRSLSVVSAPKDRAVLLLKRGLIESAQGRSDAALETLRQSVANDGTLFESRYAYAVALLAGSKPNPKAAFEQYRAADKLRPNDGEVQLGLASTQSQLGNYSAAYQNAQNAARLLATEPARVAAARYIAGRSAYLAAIANPASGAEWLRRATLEFRALVAQDTGNSEYRYWLGLTLLQRKEYTSAIESLIEAIKISPGNLELRVALSAAYIGAKRFSDAETVARAVVKAAPNNADAWFNLGLALLNQSRNAEGKKALQTAARLGNQAAATLLKKL